MGPRLLPNADPPTPWDEARRYGDRKPESDKPERVQPCLGCLGGWTPTAPTACPNHIGTTQAAEVVFWSTAGKSNSRLWRRGKRIRRFAAQPRIARGQAGLVTLAGDPLVEPFLPLLGWPGRAGQQYLEKLTKFSRVIAAQESRLSALFLYSIAGSNGDACPAHVSASRRLAMQIAQIASSLRV